MLKLCALACVFLAVTVDGGFKFRRGRGHGRFKKPEPEECPAVTVYLEQGTFNDTDAFYNLFDQSLQDQQCNPRGNSKNYGCNRYSNDVPYRDIFSYLRRACDNDFPYSKPSYLRTLLLDYCDYHCPSNDERVAEAYNCSTGCALADQLNQLCKARADRLANPECPDGFSAFNETRSCYQFFAGTKNFVDAKIDCERMEGQLVQIDSVEENTFVFNLINAALAPDSSASAYIGLNDLAVESDFRWATSNDPLGYRNWGLNQPNNSSDNTVDCVVMNVNRAFAVNATWNDVGQCSSIARTYVCERDPLP